jgi:hypothetical protein
MTVYVVIYQQEEGGYIEAIYDNEKLPRRTALRIHIGSSLKAMRLPASETRLPHPWKLLSARSSVDRASAF